jgi:hypothetical protein
MKKRVLYAFTVAFAGIILFCVWVFYYTTDAVACLEEFERVMRIKELFYKSIG